MQIYQQFFAQRLHILIPLFMRFAFWVKDYQDQLAFRTVIGSITVVSLAIAYYLHNKNQKLKNFFTLFGFMSLVISPIFSNGGLGDPGTPLYIIGFTVFCLWAIGIEQARSVILSTLFLIGISIIHYYSGYAQIMDINDHKSFLGIPLKEALGAIAILIALFFLICDYLNKHAKLKDINSKQEHFISHLNHEMRNPLQGIKGVLDIMKNHQIPAERFDYLLENAIQTTEHLNDMVNDVLNLKQLRSGMFKDSPVSSNIRNVVETCTFIYSEQANQKGIKFEVNYNNLPDQLFISKKSTKMILSNICSNAVKYTGHGEIKVDISFSENLLTFIIQDTGIGIPKTDIDKIYDEYYQVNQEITKTNQGTGLGLSMIKQLIERLHGTITVHSTPDIGSTFTVCLPAKLVNRPKRHLDSVPSNPQHLKHNFAGTSILIVEDNMINREILKEQLEVCSVHIEEAEDGAKALELIKTRYYDVVLSDIAMPNLDGISLVKTVRQFDPQLTMIAISGNTLHNETSDYYDAGFDYVMSKPYSTEKLYDIIHKVRKRQLIEN